jgi:hypothetical protein
MVEVVDNSSTNDQPFLCSSWLNNCGAEYSVFKTNNTSAALSRFSLRGVKALATPLWALDCGLSIECSQSDFIALSEYWLSRPEAIKLIDLPPSDSITTFVRLHAPSGFRTQWRHTRQIDLHSPLPSTRRKQIRRAERAGITCKLVDDWRYVTELHAESRNRKDLKSNNSQLSKLLTAISSEPFSFAVEATDSNGECIAAGGFVFTSTDTCLYSFGGQIRSQQSGIASVLMLSFAMAHALEKGASTFDFGGSSDPGVDRFYKEFGAEFVPRARLVAVVWWLRPVVWALSPFVESAKMLR